METQWSGGQNVERQTPGGFPQHPKQEQRKDEKKRGRICDKKVIKDGSMQSNNSLGLIVQF